IRMGRVFENTAKGQGHDRDAIKFCLFVALRPSFCAQRPCGSGGHCGTNKEFSAFHDFKPLFSQYTRRPPTARRLCAPSFVKVQAFLMRTAARSGANVNCGFTIASGVSARLVRSPDPLLKTQCGRTSAPQTFRVLRYATLCTVKSPFCSTK